MVLSWAFKAEGSACPPRGHSHNNESREGESFGKGRETARQAGALRAKNKSRVLAQQEALAATLPTIREHKGDHYSAKIKVRLAIGARYEEGPPMPAFSRRRWRKEKTIAAAKGGEYEAWTRMPDLVIARAQAARRHGHE